MIPVIGASGAIAGVLGAYLILYPGAKVSTLIPIVFIPWIVRIPAFVVMLVWFASISVIGLPWLIKNPYILAAINPWEGWADTYREVAYHGGIPDTWFFPYLWQRWEPAPPRSWIGPPKCKSTPSSTHFGPPKPRISPRSKLPPSQSRAGPNRA